MNQHLLSRGFILAAALALTACPSTKKCTSNADCTVGQVCSVMSGTCTAGTGGGIGTTGGGSTATGGGSGGGTTGGGTATGGGSTTGGGTATGGGGGGTMMTNGGETCDMAVTVVAGSYQGDTTGKMNDFAPPPSCTGYTNPGAEVVYKVVVPAGKRLSVRVTPEIATTTNQYDPSVYLVPGPASSCSAMGVDGGSAVTCVGGSDHPTQYEAVEGAAWMNTTSGDLEIFVVVDSGWDMEYENDDGGSTGGVKPTGKFTLDVTLDTPPAGDRCEQPVALAAGQTLNETLTGFSHDYGRTSTCSGSPSSDKAYEVSIPAGQVLTLTVTPSSTLNVAIDYSTTAANCGVTCAEKVDTGPAGQVETWVHKNGTSAAQTVLVVVDGMDNTTGTYTINAVVALPPADDVCSGATVVTPGTPLTAQTLAGYTNDYTGSMGSCTFRTGPDRVYTVDVPAGKRLEFTVTPSSTATLDAWLALTPTATCAMACEATADTGSGGDPETVKIINRGSTVVTYTVVVDSWSGTGTFDVSAVLTTPAADEVCAGATALTAAAPLTNQTTAGYDSDYGFGTNCASSGVVAGDRAYLVSVPAGQRGTVTITPINGDGGTFGPSLSLVEGPATNCEVMPRVCAGGVAGATTVRSVSYYNQSASAKDVYAIVDSFAPAGGNFDLSYAAGVPAADDLCTTAATVLTSGTPLTSTLSGFVSDYNSGDNCSSGASGPDRVFRFTVPALQVATLVATPADVTGMGPDLVLNVIETSAAVCDSATRSCAAGINDTYEGEVETLAYVNVSNQAQQVFVVVGDFNPRSSNTGFTLDATNAAIPSGEVCQTATVISASGVTAGLSWMGFSGQYSFSDSSCAYYPGADRVFSITLNANQTLTATVTPDASGMADPSVSLIEGPATNCVADAMCVASSDDPLDAATPEVVTVTNSSGAAKTYFLVIGSYADGTYSLNVDIH